MHKISFYLVTTLSTFSLTFKAMAQEAGQPAQNPIMQFVPMLLIFAIFYFLMIRPQKKKLDNENKMLGALNKGDEVYTKSGILGKIIGITEKVITLEVNEGVKIKLLKSQIAGLSAPLFEKPQTAKAK